MSRRAGPFVHALAASLCALSPVHGQTQAVTVAVDATAPGTPLERVWAFHGYDEANVTTTPDGEELLRTLSALHRAPVHVRTHFLFNTGDGALAPKWGSTNVYTEDAAGNPVYDYTLLDGIMDATLDAGALPLVELGFMPEALSTQPSPYRNSGTYTLDGGCFYPPRDYDAWAALVGAWATHVKERYPDAEALWQWELWNEPDIPYWHGTFDEFARLYDYTEAALHAVFPQASLGGPAVATPATGFLRQFLAHCATGTNAVTGEPGTRLDMVSFHAKGGVIVVDGNVRMDLGSQLRLHRAGFDAVAMSAFARTPIVISEADPDGCAACNPIQNPAYAYRNSSAYGAYEVAMMKRSLDLAAEMDVNLRGVLAWAFTFPGTPYFAGYRVLTTNGLHMPVLNAFKLLGRLSGQRLPLASSGAMSLDDVVTNGVRGASDVDGLASADGDELNVLVWNYHDDLVAAEPASVTLELAVPPSFPANALVTHVRVDEVRGNAYTAWVSQGSPAAPSTAELAALREAMEPAVLERERVVAVKDGVVRVAFDLPRFGLSLVTLTPSHAKPSEPEPPSDDGCSCRASPAAPAGWFALLALSLGGVLAFRRRFGRRSARQPAFKN